MTTTACTGQELLKRVAQGDSAAFEEFHDRYRGLVRAGATRVLGSCADIDDVCQDVFITLWREANRYDPSRGSLNTWIGLLARRRALDCLRSKLRHKAGAFDEVVNGGTTNRSGVDDCVRSEDAERAREAFEHLPQAHRAALKLVYFGGMTGRQVAAAQQVPWAAVKTRLWRGIQRLRADLDAA